MSFKARITFHSCATGSLQNKKGNQNSYNATEGNPMAYTQCNASYSIKNANQKLQPPIPIYIPCTIHSNSSIDTNE